MICIQIEWRWWHIHIICVCIKMNGIKIDWNHSWLLWDHLAGVIFIIFLYTIAYQYTDCYATSNTYTKNYNWCALEKWSQVILIYKISLFKKLKLLYPPCWNGKAAACLVTSGWIATAATFIRWATSIWILNFILVKKLT